LPGVIDCHSSKTEPAGRKRDPAFIFVAIRPAENVKNEVSAFGCLADRDEI
jgi:hypothetical protein